MAEDKSVDQPWTFTLVHGSEHPDNNEPLTKVAQASEEAVAKEEAAMNALYAAGKETPAVSPQAGEPQAKAVNYEEKTVDELKTLAHERGIDVPWDARKADLIKALEKHDKGKG